MVDVSIITTVRNGHLTLDRCISSVVNQSHPDWEMIIVDDGSTDNSREIVSAWASRDSRIRLVPSPPVGRARALNMAVEHAGAEWIAILDCDDEFHPRKLEFQLRAVHAHPECAVLGTGWKYVTGYAPVTLDEFSSDPEARPIRRRDLCLGNPIAHSSVLMRKSALIELGGYDLERKSQLDYELSHRHPRT